MLGFPATDGGPAPLLTPSRLGRHSPPVATAFFSVFILRLPLLSFLYSFFSSSGALWPGIKTETGLPEAPSGGQPGFLSFSTAYTSSQQGHLHYSYPNQGKLRLHPASQNNTTQLTPVESQLFHSFVIFEKHFFFPILVATSTVLAEHLRVSRLELHHVKRVFKHSFGYSHHHSSLHSDSTGESCLSQEKRENQPRKCVHVRRLPDIISFYFILFVQMGPSILMSIYIYRICQRLIFILCPSQQK